MAAAAAAAERISKAEKKWSEESVSTIWLDERPTAEAPSTKERELEASPPVTVLQEMELRASFSPFSRRDFGGKSEG